MGKGERWVLHEYVLCLDLYLRRGPVGNTDPEVVEIAGLIGRTPGSVALRLGNFQFVDPDRTGPGLEGGHRDCQEVWRLLAGDREVLSGMAEFVRRTLG